jgi:hypothetical protein
MKKYCLVSCNLDQERMIFNCNKEILHKKGSNLQFDLFIKNSANSFRRKVFFFGSWNAETNQGRKLKGDAMNLTVD